MCSRTFAPWKAILSVLLVLGASVSTLVIPRTALAAPAPDANSVLILDSSVTGGAGSIEATQAASLGFTVVVVNAATWGAMTSAEFASYRALVLGDPTCVAGTGPIAAAEANKAVWGAAVDGNVIIIGTDPTYHSGSQPGAVTLENRGIAFAGASATKTGAYICLSCYYFDAASGTGVPVLDPFGSFTVVGQGGCPANSHIIATHPALTGLTDAALSNWGCSTHEGFVAWPATFDPLAISLDVPSPFVAADGTTGAPYIMARGATLLSDICVSPDTATNEVGTPHTICAFVNNKTDCSGTGIGGITVCANVIAGPCSLLSIGCAVTDSAGRACFTYTCNTVGTDVIEVSYVDGLGRRHFQKVTKNWIPVRNQRPDCSGARPSVAELWPPNHKFVGVNVLGVTDPDGDPVTITITGITQDEPTNTVGDGNTCPDATVSGSTAMVRAERTGNTRVPGNGRVYAISFDATDGKGGKCSGTVRVCVPHDQRPGHACVDDGQSYNSMVCVGSAPAGSYVDPDAVGIGSALVKGNSAVIEYSLPTESDVQMDVFDVLGRKLATLERARRIAGVHQANWNTAGVKGGVYYVRLQAGPVTVSKSVLVLK